ncbi:MAG TPA: hypothetical protein IAA07_12000 [Candidatus Lachnoclostridium stercoravium]|uniref:Cell wall binding repeat-containing protein n=1 Tax=Candidatus Lachnoclostridium stercoravium TaxID=2838633 RepID=A0A9D2HK68_9FIRM|nr:hypothetical protein [Candidatus Lachnoclostridium stercoravium]
MKKVLVTAAIMTAAMNMTVFAAGWQQNANGWWYATNESGTEWYADGWQWIDGNQDGTAECYYFDENGYILANTVTPDGYYVNADGAWIIDGQVQTAQISSGEENEEKFPLIPGEYYNTYLGAQMYIEYYTDSDVVVANIVAGDGTNFSLYQVWEEGNTYIFSDGYSGDTYDIIVHADGSVELYSGIAAIDGTYIMTYDYSNAG